MPASVAGEGRHPNGHPYLSGRIAQCVAIVLPVNKKRQAIIGHQTDTRLDTIGFQIK
jgi:hypothetical protein